MSRGVCHVPGCERRRYAHGWCRPHYSRWQRHGDVCADIPVGSGPLNLVCYRCIDIEHLLNCDEDPHDIARRTGRGFTWDTPPADLRESVRRHLTKCARPDLLTRYNAAIARQVHA